MRNNHGSCWRDERRCFIPHHAATPRIYKRSLYFPQGANGNAALGLIPDCKSQTRRLLVASRRAHKARHHHQRVHRKKTIDKRHRKKQVGRCTWQPPHRSMAERTRHVTNTTKGPLGQFDQRDAQIHHHEQSGWSAQVCALETFAAGDEQSLRIVCQDGSGDGSPSGTGASCASRSSIETD
jgi:hypothetical protein